MDSAAKKVVIIGGGAAGMATATRIRRHSSFQVTVISKDSHTAYSHCGIPFVFEGEIESFEKLVVRPSEFFRRMGIEVILNAEVRKIDLASKTVLAGGRAYPFDKLIITTGSSPFIPETGNKNVVPYGIFTLRSLEDGIRIEKALGKAKNLCVIGGGTIGVECAAAAAKRGVRTLLVSRSENILSKQLDSDMAEIVRQHMEALGIGVITGEKVIFPTDFWKEKALNIGKNKEMSFPADLVLLASGAKPETALARAADLEIGKSGGIVVNEYLQVRAGNTYLPHVYAGGECAEVRDFITGAAKISQLGSTARRMANVLADNICGKEGPVSTFGPVLDPWVSVAAGLQFGGVGLTEKQAKRHGIKLITGQSIGSTRASYYPGKKKVFIKLLFQEECLVGAQVVGGEGVKERIDTLSLAIRKKSTVRELLEMETCYAPPVSTLLDPLYHAIRSAFKKMKGKS